jgi:hypothetical protein
MAKKDYFELAYKILAYLYACFQSGEAPNIKFYGAEALDINREYWLNIMESLLDEGYIKGAEVLSGANGYRALQNIDIKITLSGITFLQDNSMIAKAKDALKTAKEIIPGI